VSSLKPIDLHAHVDVRIDAVDLRRLNAVVFAATRSLDEAEAALSRTDEYTVWGVGCHPGLVRAHKAFSAERFAGILKETAFASEIGLDGGSRVPMSTQRRTLRAVLSTLQSMPRIASLHSYKATSLVLDELADQPVKGAVLHWWLGNQEETRRAIDLGCFFSINTATVLRSDALGLVPLDRVLTETDHPFGDRRGGDTARPGKVMDVEYALAEEHDVSVEQIRAAMWDNLASLANETGAESLLPRRVRLEMMAR
jgi:TatD DNase family protein